MQTPEILTQLTKANLLTTAPIYQMQEEITQCYVDSAAISHLYTHDMLEISIVVEGEGIHQILSEAIPCKRGDIYIIGASTPHGYLLADENGKLKVKKLLFDIKDWFHSDIASHTSERYCYGIFRDNPTTAYAMLNADRVVLAYYI